MKPHSMLLAGVTVTGLFASCPSLAAKCTIGKMAEVPVVMSGMQPTMTAKINGVEATFIVDSGAWYSNLSRATAEQFHLPLSDAPFELRESGIGGTIIPQVATVKTFTIFNVNLPRVEFTVGGSEVGAAGYIGQNLLRIGDVEYDLANGVIRLMRSEGCKKTLLAYWAKPDQPYSLMDIEWATPAQPHTIGTALLNGVKIRVVFDTGAATSFVSLRAANRAGVHTDDPDVKPAGYMQGIGRSVVKSWIAPVESFKVGDNEEIRHTKLRIGDFDLSTGDMLLGVDFFLSHRIYVAAEEKRVFFTYNGGPVFNLSQSLPASAGGAPGRGAPDGPAAPGQGAPGQADAAKSGAGQADPAAEPGANGAAELGADADTNTLSKDPTIPPGEPTDAAGFSRRGVAYAARRDFAHAIADLDRACELNPNEPSYFYQRGIVHRENRQLDLARADFDQALKLKPDDVATLIARAQLRLASRDGTGAQSDLYAADRAAAREADIRSSIGTLYAYARDYPAAIRQYDLWISVHPYDVRTPQIVGDRCLARVLLEQDLDKALPDCDTALKKYPTNGLLLNSRAIIEFRMNRFDKALSDWDADVKGHPKGAWALYCRGVAKIRKGMTAEGQADIDAAKAMRPNVIEEGKRRRITPS